MAHQKMYFLPTDKTRYNFLKHLKNQFERDVNFLFHLFNVFMGCFFYVPWPGIKLTTEAYWDDALTNWATQPGLKQFFFFFFNAATRDRWVGQYREPRNRSTYIWKWETKAVGFAYQSRKDVLPNKWCWANCLSIWRKTEQHLYFIRYTKINSYGIKT